MRHWLRAGVALGCVSASVVRADLSFQGNNSDGTGVPYYQTYLETGNQIDGNPQGGFAITDGIIYRDNNVPLGSGTVNIVNSNVNGASVTAYGASANGGFFSARNKVYMHVDNAKSTDGYYTLAGQGSRTQVEFFTPVDAVRAVFHWHVEGNQQLDAGTAQSRLDFLAAPHGEVADKDYYYLYDAQHLTAFGNGDFTYNLPTPLNTPIDLFFWTSAYAELDPGDTVDGHSYSLTADYYDTYTMDQIDLYDANDNLIPNWTMQDDATGQVVFNQDGPVPEPSLLLTSVAGIALLRRRRA